METINGSLGGRENAGGYDRNNELMTFTAGHDKEIIFQIRNRFRDKNSRDISVAEKNTEKILEISV